MDVFKKGIPANIHVVNPFKLVAYIFVVNQVPILVSIQYWVVIFIVFNIVYKLSFVFFENIIIKIIEKYVMKIHDPSVYFSYIIKSTSVYPS